MLLLGPKRRLTNALTSFQKSARRLLADQLADAQCSAERPQGDAKGFGISIGNQLLNLAVRTLPQLNCARQ